MQKGAQMYSEGLKTKFSKKILKQTDTMSVTEEAMSSSLQPWWRVLLSN